MVTIYIRGRKLPTFLHGCFFFFFFFFFFPDAGVHPNSLPPSVWSQDNICVFLPLHTITPKIIMATDLFLFYFV